MFMFYMPTRSLHSRTQTKSRRSFLVHGTNLFISGMLAHQRLKYRESHAHIDIANEIITLVVLGMFVTGRVFTFCDDTGACPEGTWRYHYHLQVLCDVPI
ncbi:hypothetical protein M405DRAFT_116663 [Rhizopogon salebrosus TDB-379]|nr:hypothetical protein M405DRAFT_116663 [Rhizopogon salebrosus TDB-379]